MSRLFAAFAKSEAGLVANLPRAAPTAAALPPPPPLPRSGSAASTAAQWSPNWTPSTPSSSSSASSPPSSSSSSSLSTSKFGTSPAREPGLAHRFQLFLRGPRISPADLASVSTLLGKKQARAKDTLAAVGIQIEDSELQQMLEQVRQVSIPRIRSGEFQGKELTELLHAMTRLSNEQSFVELLKCSSDSLVKAVPDMAPRALALVANAMAHGKLREGLVMLQVAKRGAETIDEADAAAVAALCHAFGHVGVYHHRLIFAIKKRLPEVLSELSPAEVAGSLNGLAKAVAPLQKKDPSEVAFDEVSPRGFGTAVRPLLERLRQEVAKGSVKGDTAVMALQALALLRCKETNMLQTLLSDKVLRWRQRTVSDLCTILHAAASLEARVPCQPRELLAFPVLRTANHQQICMLALALNLLFCSSRSPWRGSVEESRVWWAMLSKSIVVASNGLLGSARQVSRTAGPAVPIMSLDLLGSWSGHWGRIARLEDLKKCLRYAESLQMRAEQFSKTGAITTSELQTTVELTIRRIAIIDELPHDWRTEVSASPYWIDLVAHPRFASSGRPLPDDAIGDELE